MIHLLPILAMLHGVFGQPKESYGTSFRALKNKKGPSGLVQPQKGI